MKQSTVQRVFAAAFVPREGSSRMQLLEVLAPEFLANWKCCPSCYVGCDAHFQRPVKQLGHQDS